MSLMERKWQVRCFGATLVVLVLASALLAGENRAKPSKIGEYDPKAKTVEMFDAIAKGTIAVKLIPKDSTQSNIVIENKTKQPLNVKLPEAFAGVPALAQAGGAARRGGGSSGNANQGVGGGGGGMGGMGGGFGCIPAEGVGTVKVPTVCLDHGKGEPRASIPYEIKPLESYTTKSGVYELCQMLGLGKLDQRAAQAAAWHLNNGMTWEQLAAKQVRRANGQTQPYFSARELNAAMQISSAAEHSAKEHKSKHHDSDTTPIEKK